MPIVTFDAIAEWCSLHGVDVHSVESALIVLDAKNGGSHGILPLVELTVRVPLVAFPPLTRDR
jgi:hypothetical protein